jgi:hypothetical protein
VIGRHDGVLKREIGLRTAFGRHENPEPDRSN